VDSSERHINPYIFDMIQTAASTKKIVPSDTHTFTTAEEASALVLARKGAAFLTREARGEFPAMNRNSSTGEENLKLVTGLATRADEKNRLTRDSLALLDASWSRCSTSTSRQITSLLNGWKQAR